MLRNRILYGFAGTYQIFRFVALGILLGLMTGSGEESVLSRLGIAFGGGAFVLAVLFWLESVQGGGAFLPVLRIGKTLETVTLVYTTLSLFSPLAIQKTTLIFLGSMALCDTLILTFLLLLRPGMPPEDHRRPEAKSVESLPDLETIDIEEE